MRSGVDHRPECHRVCHLSVEPDVLVCREEPCELGSDDTDDVAEHGDEDEETIKGEDKTSAARSPHGELEPVQRGELCVRCLQSDCEHGCKDERKVTHLAVPSIGEQEEVGAIEQEIEREPPR